MNANFAENLAKPCQNADQPARATDVGAVRGQAAQRRFNTSLGRKPQEVEPSEELRGLRTAAMGRSPKAPNQVGGLGDESPGLAPPAGIKGMRAGVCAEGGIWVDAAVHPYEVVLPISRSAQRS